MKTLEASEQLGLGIKSIFDLYMSTIIVHTTYLSFVGINLYTFGKFDILYIY